MNIYKNYSKYYDLLYNDKNYRKEADYASILISKYSKKSKNILELGCGTGIHAIELARKGYIVDGIDFSKGMLEMAEKRINNMPKNLATKIHFCYGDMRKFRNKKRYDIVVSLFNVMGYMVTNDDIEAAMITASMHLKAGGLFIFDAWYGPAALTDRPKKRVKKLENKDIKIIRTATPRMFPNENKIDVNYDMLITNKKDKKSEKYSETHIVRYLFKPEVEMFLKKTGFELINSEQWLTGKKSNFNTWRVCFVAKKR